MQKQYELFIDELLQQVFENLKTPKVQSERESSPILFQPFIKKIMKQITGKEYVLAFREFPFKKEAGPYASSINVDYMLLPIEDSEIDILELKFVSKPSDHDLKIILPKYLQISEKVQELKSAEFLLKDFYYIATKSDSSKYENLIKNIKGLSFSQFKKVNIHYLVPTSYANHLRRRPEAKDINIIALNELKKCIDGEHEIIWKEKIYKCLQKVDCMLLNDNMSTEFNEIDGLLKLDHECNESFSQHANLLRRIYKQCKELNAVGVRLSKSIIKPNYQIYLNDGSKIPFRNSGQRYTQATCFHENKLRDFVKLDRLEDIFATTLSSS